MHSHHYIIQNVNVCEPVADRVAAGAMSADWCWSQCHINCLALNQNL